MGSCLAGNFMVNTRLPPTPIRAKIMAKRTHARRRRGMSKQYAYQVARELGGIAAAARLTLGKLAISVARAAQRHEIDEDDANALYETYIKASLGGQKINTTSNAFKANASKLRQIIKCALLTPLGSPHDHTRDTVQMLQLIDTTHEKLCKSVPCVPLYEAMVSACRKRVAQKGRPLSEDALVKLIRK